MIKSTTHTVCILSLCCSIFLISCEQDIDFQYEEKIVTSENLEICAAQECPTIEVRYVSFKVPKSLEKSISGWTLATIASSLNQENAAPQNLGHILETFINNAQTGYPETITLSNSHEFVAEVVLLYTSNELVSLRYYADVFDGGAHGFYQERYANFDPKTGDLFMPNDLVNEAFYAFAQAQFATSYPKSIFEIAPASFAQSILQLGFTQEKVILLYKDPTLFLPEEQDYKITIPWSDAKRYLNF